MGDRRNNKRNASMSLRRSGLLSGSAGRMSTIRFNHDEEAFLERLQYLDTAMEALPGRTLKAYFAPLMQLKKGLILRRRRTALRMPEATRKKVIDDAVQRLAKAMSDVAMEVLPNAPFALDPNELSEALQGKMEVVSYGPGEILSYPNEPPEAAFVYVLLQGAATMHHFQPLLQRPTVSGFSRRLFFTSSEEAILLCGGGVVEHPRAAALVGGTSVLGGGGVGGETASEGGGGGGPSISNMTAAASKHLRMGLKAVGQPTLELMRSEGLRSPSVIGASEAMGFSPRPCSTLCATPTPASVVAAAAATGGLKRLTGEALDVVRVRVADVHSALVSIVMSKTVVPLAGIPPLPLPPHMNNGKGVTASPSSSPAEEKTAAAAANGAPVRSAADVVMAARTRVLTNYYPLSETIMRQSWLLQDTPAQAIRILISHLTPHTYMPGDVLACPHGSTPRQLCFLRRGTLAIVETPRAAEINSSGGNGTQRSHRKGQQNGSNRGAGRSASPYATPTPPNTSICLCGDASGARTLELVQAGASYGELSVLFGEPREYVLVAKSMCDVWSLTYRDFALLMQRDDALRRSLVEKAAALRIKWLGEQRFSSGLLRRLRDSCELFRPIPDIAMRLIQERIEPVVYSPGELVASTAERCTGMIFIMQGRVESLVNGLASYSAGHVLGGGCLVAHRWPIALSAKTMVEGWILSRERLLDALRRMDVLCEHSGQRTSLFSVYMRQVFAPPLPELGGGVVQHCMPEMPPAPGGTSYVEYGRCVSEIMLRAVCVLFKGFVKWEDINYASLSEGTKGELAHNIAQREAIQQIKDQSSHISEAKKAKVKASIASELDRAQKKQPSKRRQGQQQQHQQGTTTAGSSQAKSPTPKHSSKPKRSGLFSAFLVDRNSADHPFAANVDRRPPVSNTKLDRAFVDQVGEKPLLDASYSVQDAQCTRRLQRLFRIPRHLQKFKRVLEERDRMCEDAIAAQNEAMTARSGPGGGAVMAADGGDTHVSVRRELQQVCFAAQAILHHRMSLSPQVAPLAPAHLFLQAEKPRGEITLEEALAIEYVLQLPTTNRIQDCVPIIDPDVCVGLPHHRARRCAMSITPNDRHHKHNFLFAASHLSEGGRGGGADSHRRVEKSGGVSSASGRSRDDSANGGRSSRSSHTDGDGESSSRHEGEVDDDLIRAKVDTLIGLLQGSVSPRQQAAYNRSQQAIESRAMTASRARSYSLTNGHPPMHFAAGAASVTPPIVSPPPERSISFSMYSPGEFSQGQSFFANPHEGFSAAATATAAAEREMVELLRTDPQQALEALFTRFESFAPAEAPLASQYQFPDSVPRAPLTQRLQGLITTFPVSILVNRGAGEDRRAELVQQQQDGEAVEAGTTEADSEGKESTTQAESAADGEEQEVKEEGSPDQPKKQDVVAMIPPLAPTSAPAPAPSQRHISLRHVRLTRDGRFHLSQQQQQPNRTKKPVPSTTTAGEGTTSEQQQEQQSPRATVLEDPLCAHFRHTQKSLLVDGVGMLNSDSFQQNFSMTGSRRASLSFSTGGRRMSLGRRASTSLGYLTGAGGDEDGMGGMMLSGSDMVSGSGAGGHHISASQYSLSDAAPLEPKDFVMPTVAEAAMYMELMQRDVEGLNAVAAEQLREREKLKFQQNRGGERYERVQRCLAEPSAEERLIIQGWGEEQELAMQDPLRLFGIPRALIRHAGEDYLTEEIDRLRDFTNPPTNKLNSVLAWHDSVEEAAGERSGELPHPIPVPGTAGYESTLPPLSPGLPGAAGLPGALRGSLKKRRSSEQSTSSAAARNVVAVVGCSQLSGAAPSCGVRTTRRSRSEVKETEDFLAEYAQRFPASQ